MLRSIAQESPTQANVRTVRRIRPGEWILLFGIVCVLAASVLVTGLHELAYVFVYSFVSNVFIAIVPHEPGMIYFGKLFPPVLVAAVGGLGTAAAAFLDYHSFSRVVRIKRLQRLYRDKHLYELARRFFQRYPTATLAVAGFLPLPFAPFKFMAVSSGHTEEQYIFAVAVGRIPRYYLLALLGSAWNLPNEGILILLVALVLVSVASAVRALRNNHRNG